MFRACLIVFLIAMACASCSVAAGAQPATGEVVRRILNARDTIQFSGVQVVVRPSVAGLESVTRRVHYGGSGMFRIETVSSSGDVTHIMVGRTGSFEHYVPELGIAFVGDGFEGILPVIDERIRDLVSSARVDPPKSGSVLGRPAVVLSGEDRWGRRATVWVDADHWVVLRAELSQSAGNADLLMFFTEVDFGPPDPSVFGVPYPPDTKVFRTRADFLLTLDLGIAARRLGFAPFYPAFVPPGLAYAGSELIQDGGLPTLHTRYAGKGKLISLFQRAVSRPSLSRAPVRIKRPLPEGLLGYEWQVDGVEVIMLVPKYSDESQVQAMGRSLVRFSL